MLLLPEHSVREDCPSVFLIELSREEWERLKSKFLTSTKRNKVQPPAGFTESGLYIRVDQKFNVDNKMTSRQVVQQNEVQEKIIVIRDQRVIIDANVAELYGVETKRINEAVKNNTEKFPDGYLFELSKKEWDEVKSKFSTSPLGGGKVKLPNAFTEKGLYMLATILKSPKAIETTIAIIETFSKVKELGRAIHQVQTLAENSPKHQSLVEHTSDLIADLIIPDNDLEVTGSETTYEMNFAVFKIKRTIKKGK